MRPAANNAGRRRRLRQRAAKKARRARHPRTPSGWSRPVRQPGSDPQPLDHVQYCDLAGGPVPRWLAKTCFMDDLATNAAFLRDEGLEAGGLMEGYGPDCPGDGLQPICSACCDGLEQIEAMITQVLDEVWPPNPHQLFLDLLGEFFTDNPALITSSNRLLQVGVRHALVSDFSLKINRCRALLHAEIARRLPTLDLPPGHHLNLPLIRRHIAQQDPTPYEFKTHHECP